MDASKILNNLSSLIGVRGAFLFNESAEPISVATKAGHSDMDVGTLGHTAAQGLAGLTSMDRGKRVDLDLVYQDGRLLIRSIQAGLLCILCDRLVNLPLLTMTTEQSVGELRERALELGIASAKHPSRDRKETLKQIAHEILGDHAPKVISIIDDSGESDDELRAAVVQAERTTRLFIDKRKAGELAVNMISALDE